MTSNLGARHLQKRTTMGFQSGADAAGQKSMEDMVMNEVKRVFTQGLFIPLQETIIFNTLRDQVLILTMNLLTSHIDNMMFYLQLEVETLMTRTTVVYVE